MGDDDVRWARHLWSSIHKMRFPCFIYRGQLHSQPSCLVMFCHVLLTVKILRCKAALPFASSAVLINIYFQEHKENIFHILAFLTSLDLQHCLGIFNCFPDTCQSIVNEVLAKKPKRRVEWVPFTTRSSCFWPQIWCSLHISSCLIDVWYASKRLFQVSYIFSSADAISRRVVKTMSQVLVVIVSQHLAATQQHPATIEDPMMKQWEHGLYFKKSGQQMTTGFRAFHSQNGMMWEILRWNYNEIFQLPTHHYINFCCRERHVWHM